MSESKAKLLKERKDAKSIYNYLSRKIITAQHELLGLQARRLRYKEVYELAEKGLQGKK